jgi:hypothetical protein
VSGDSLVECYSGTEYAQRPVRFFWQGEWQPVGRVRAERRIPGGKQFEVEEEDGGILLLTYTEAGDLWTIRPST